MLNPVDPTTTPAWKRLTELHDTMTPDLRAWFADDPQRAERFSYELGDLSACPLYPSPSPRN